MNNEAKESIDQAKHITPEASPANGFVQRRPWLKIAGGVFLLLLVAGGALWWWALQHYESTDDAQVDGYIHPISARISGHLIAVHVHDGEFVKAGTTLVEIDPRDYHTALARARSEYANAEATASAARFGVPVSQAGSLSQIQSAEADVAVADSGVVAAQRQVDQAEASLAQARASAKTANADADRYALLIEKREISQQQYDQSLAAAESANAAVTAGEAAVRAAQEQVRQADSKVRQARAHLANARASTMTVEATEARAKSSEAQVATAKAALAQAELNRSYTGIVAPTDGIVGRRTAQIGQNVEPGQELMTIVPIADLWVTANFKETQLARMRPRQLVNIAVDGCRSALQGRVTSIGGATGARYSLLPPENATGNFVKVVQRIPVRLDFERSGDRPCLLRPGMSVEPSVRVQ